MASTLPNPEDCCVRSCENETVEVPGPQGPAGADGTNGTNGINAFTTVTDGFNMPAVGADTASLLVGNSQWMVPTQVVYVSGAGYMEVRSKADGTHVVLRNLGYTGNTAPATPIPGGQTASPGGLTGTDGSNGTNGADGSDGINAFTATTADFTQPAELATVTIDVQDNSWVGGGQILFVEGGGYYEVTALIGGTQITLRNLADSSTGAYADNAAPTTIIADPAKVSPGGLQGPIANTVNEAVAITYQVSAGTAPPALTPNIPPDPDWETYPLNTLSATSGISPDCSLVANQFTVPAGRYQVMAAVQYEQAKIRLRIFDTGGAGDLLQSLNSVSSANGVAILFGIIEATGDAMELQYYAVDNATAAFGPSTTVPLIDEAYASVMLTRLQAT